MRLYEFKCGCGETAEHETNEPPLCICGRVMVRDWRATNVIYKGADFPSNANRPDYTEI